MTEQQQRPKRTVHLIDRCVAIGQEIVRRDPVWAPQLVVAAAIAIDLALPNQLTIGPSWLLPAVEATLLFGLVGASPHPRLRHSPVRRRVALLLIGLVSAVNAFSLIELVHYLLRGGKASGRELIFSGVGLWLTNVLLFGLWYWELDRGGPLARANRTDAMPDFQFPNMTDEIQRIRPDWMPGLIDYLYVSLTNASAFSPTDTMPLTPTAKLLMGGQALISMLILVLVVSRAVNILAAEMALETGELEQEIQRIGAELHASFPSTLRHPLRAVDARAMEYASSDRELQAALFRFVDVVPACRSLDDVARHLTAFLDEVPDAPLPLEAAMRVAHTKAGRAALGAAAARGVRHIAHRFIVGETPKSALSVLAGLWRRGIASSVDLLGEATVTEAEADRYAQRCSSALSELVAAVRGWPERAALECDGSGTLPRANLSVKVSALTPLLRPDAPELGRSDAARRLRPLLAQAHEQGAHIHIDMESLDSREAVLELVLEMLSEPEFRDGPSTGVVLQAYLRDSPEQLDQILAWAGSSERTPAASGPAREGRLLGPRARAGATARLAGARVRGESRVRPQFRDAHPAPARGPAAPPGGRGLAQPALGRQRDRA